MSAAVIDLVHGSRFTVHAAKYSVHRALVGDRVVGHMKREIRASFKSIRAMYFSEEIGQG